MRREIDWRTPVQFLRTVGPVRARALARLGIETAGDLLLHYPRRYFDRSQATGISRLVPGREATVLGEILTAGERRMRRGGSLQTVTVADGSGVLFLVWFNQPYLLKQLRSGQRLMCSGLVQLHAGRPQMTHPDWEILDGGGDPVHTGRLVPVYGLTHGLGQHWLRTLVHATLAEILPGVADVLPEDLRRRRGLLGRAPALRAIHFPGSAEELDAARRRLAYEEILTVQLTMGLRRRGRRRNRGIRIGPPGDLTRRLVEGLPFRLTGAQRRVLAEILADLRSGAVMHRLLQGDVGSGKTLVCLIAALFVIEQGWQATLVAPTEVLARQHGRTLGGLAGPLGVRTAVLTGATPAAERRACLRAAARGEIDLLIGTHALIQDEVTLPRPGLAVVDEQHRFGVRQRGLAARAGEEGPPPHLLVMSATPIPRSLALTLYGDLDLSVIDELPAGRKPVQTRLVAQEREAEVLRAVRAELDRGRQGYIVYPVIEETEGQDLRAATAEYERLAAGPLRGRRLALLHGRLKARRKEEIMTAFAAGELEALVATTVVEVGLDVPGASFMVVHHPERFGLAQLHQLRGRVGRAGQAARCWLLVDRWLAPATGERLRFFAAHTDGFALAEEDLRLRGPGDPWGVRQHGVPGFRLANPLRDADLVRECAADVERLLASDPTLSGPDHAPLRRELHDSYGRLLPVAAAG